MNSCALNRMGAERLEFGKGIFQKYSRNILSLCAKTKEYSVTMDRFSIVWGFLVYKHFYCMKGSNHPSIVQAASEATWTFGLSPLQENVYYKGEISIDLTPLQRRRNGKRLAIHPIYNNDGKADTQGFILEIQKVGSDQIQTLAQQSTTGFESAGEELKRAPSTLEIQIPKPQSEKKICLVCRQRYGDYLEHISHISHIKKLKDNNWTRMIEEMCQQVSKEEDGLLSVGKRKCSASSPDIECEELSYNPMRNPLKKRYVEKPQKGSAVETGNTLHTSNHSQVLLATNYAN